MMQDEIRNQAVTFWTWLLVIMAAALLCVFLFAPERDIEQMYAASEIYCGG